MTSAAGLLLLAPPGIRDDLAGRIELPDLLHCCESPYDGIRQMSQRRWSAVAIASHVGDLPALCRAARRLQADAGLFALCAPIEEIDLKGLVGRVLDDYFIYPPTVREIVRLRRAASAPAAAPGPARAAGYITPDEFSRMTESTGSVEALEECIADLVSRRIGRSVRWVLAEDASERHPLLLSPAEPPRELVPAGAGAEPDADALAFIVAVQDCLPALLASARRAETLHHLAITDYLTGTYNRRYFYHLTNQILHQAEARGFNVTLLLYDIDDFKRYNDTYGYAAGDEILRDTAAMMKDITRAHDIVARIGGDEFAVLFWDADEPRHPDSEPPATAYVLADRFRRAVERHRFRSLGPEAVGVLTISGGLASFGPQGRTCRDLLRQANKALKAVKTTGKNAIQLTGAWRGNRKGE